MEDTKIKKPTLYVIEGFDRIGKDTLLDDLEERKLMKTYKLESSAMPPYRHKEEFISALHVFLSKQVEELHEIAKKGEDVVMARLEVSDYVYSNLFSRQMIADKYAEQISQDYDIVNVVFLWEDYLEYYDRCMKLAILEKKDLEIEYTKEEFDRICELYKKCPKVKYIVDNVESRTTREEILEMFEDIVAWDRKNKS